MQDKLQNKFNKYANPNFASLNKKPKIRSGGGAGLFQNRLGQKAAKLKSIVENEKESITSKITEIKEDTEEVEQKAKTSQPKVFNLMQQNDLMKDLEDLDGAEKKLKEIKKTTNQDVTNLHELKNLTMSKTKKKRKGKKKKRKKKLPKGKQPIKTQAQMQNLVPGIEDDWDKATKSAKQELIAFETRKQSITADSKQVYFFMFKILTLIG